MQHEPEYFNSLEIAINSIWIRNALDDVYDLINALKHSIRVKNTNPFGKDDKSKYCDSLHIDSIAYGDNYSRTYNPKRVLEHLTNNVYPSLRGKE
jgi:hypothetical protein